jgi:pyruvate dehydrogenase E1 component beta subunit
MRSKEEKKMSEKKSKSAWSRQARQGNEIGYLEAVDEGILQEAAKNPNVFVMGEDIAFKYKHLEAISNRVISTPISEAGFTGAAIGAALTGMRPIVIINFIDLMPLIMDQLLNQAANIRYSSGGQFSCPLVILVPQGATRGAGPQHSHSLEGWVIHIPGLKVAVPSTPEDGKGLMMTSLRGQDPVIFIQHKALRRINGFCPTEDYTIPFGVARTFREGSDVTIVSWHDMLYKSVEVADELEKEGISVEVIDPRTLVPFDEKALLKSLAKTGRLVVVQDETITGGAAAEISALAADKAFKHLKAPIKRVAAKDSPIPFADVMADYIKPNKKDIINAVKAVMKKS